MTQAPEASNINILERAFPVAPVPGVRAHQSLLEHRLLIRQLQLLKLLVDFLHISHRGASGQAATFGLRVLGTETEDGLQPLPLLQQGGKQGQIGQMR